MKNFLKKMSAFLLIALVAFGGYTAGLRYQIIKNVEAAFYAVQSPATQLYAGISSSATSARLRSFKDIGGTNLTMAMFGSVGYVTFEPGVPGKEEVVSFTGITNNGDGTQTITGLTRGLLSRYPFGTGGTARSHGSNTYVVVSNSGEFYNKFAILDTTSTTTAVWKFSSTTPPRYDLVPANHSAGTHVATTSEFASIAYVNATGAGVNVSATETVRGEIELGTATEQASSTATGSTGASTVMRTLYASSSPTVGCDGTATAGSLCTPVASTTGKIAQSYLPLSEAITFSGNNTQSGTLLVTASSTHTATTSIAASSVTNNALVVNGVAYQFPSTQGASSTVLMNNGSGVLTSNYLRACTSGWGTLGGSNATTTITHGLGSIPTSFSFQSSDTFTAGASTGIVSSFGVGTASTTGSQSTHWVSADGLNGGTARKGTLADFVIATIATGGGVTTKANVSQLTSMTFDLSNVGTASTNYSWTMCK